MSDLSSPVPAPTQEWRCMKCEKRYIGSLSDPKCPFCAVAVPAPKDTEAEKLAAQFHEAYERLAPSFGYETRKASAKPWADVPENNRRLMTAVCAEILSGMLTEDEAQHALDQIPDNQCGWPPKDCSVCDSLREKLRRLSQQGDTENEKA